MFVLCAFLLASTLVASLPLGDDPITDLIKEVINEADQYIAKEHLDQIKLPDLGSLRWDPIKLRNGRLGNFSTIRLKEKPYVEWQDNPDGSIILSFDLPLGLDHVGIFYDFRVDIFDVSRVGNCSIWTKHDLAEISGIFRTSGTQNCSATLDSFVLKEFGNLEIDVLPEDLPEIVTVGQVLLDYIAHSLLPVVNSVVKEVVETDVFRRKFSEIVCNKVPL